MRGIDGPMGMTGVVGPEGLFYTINYYTSVLTTTRVFIILT